MPTQTLTVAALKQGVTLHTSKKYVFRLSDCVEGLYDPRWQRDALSHGDEAGMTVGALGLEGRTVHFTVERDGAVVAEATATVRGGRASAAARLEHPAHADPAEGAHDRELRFHAAVLSAGALANPRFVDRALCHGDEAELAVDAPGLDGRRVRFVVEQEQNGGWRQIAEASAVVSGGVARARARLEHPAQAEAQQPCLPQGADATPRPVRFHASLEGGAP